MKIRNVVHRGLRRFIEDDDASGLPGSAVPKVRKIVSFLQDMEQAAELRSVPGWQAHQLTGGPQRQVEPVGRAQLAHHVPDRRGRHRDYRSQL
jgi:hypothetical protein